MTASVCQLHALRRQRAPWAWLLAALLLMQAAVPALAAWAAQSRGLNLVDVCSVYGTRTVAVDADGRVDTAPTPHDTQAHGSSHCALGALASTALADPPALSAVRLHAPAVRPWADTRQRILPPDAPRVWQSARKHGPPLSA